MTDLNTSQGQQLRRVLKPRHLNMIAIGGSIGTGLFVASGATVATPRPRGGGGCVWYASTTRRPPPRPAARQQEIRSLS